MFYLRKAEKLRSRQSEVFFSLGLVYEKKNNTTKALIYYKKAINVDLINFEAFVNIGNIYLQQKDFHKAKNTYVKAHNIKPQDPNIYL